MVFIHVKEFDKAKAIGWDVIYWDGEMRVARVLGWHDTFQGAMAEALSVGDEPPLVPTWAFFLGEQYYAELAVCLVGESRQHCPCYWTDGMCCECGLVAGDEHVAPYCWLPNTRLAAMVDGEPVQPGSVHQALEHPMDGMFENVLAADVDPIREHRP